MAAILFSLVSAIALLPSGVVPAGAAEGSFYAGKTVVAPICGAGEETTTGYYLPRLFEETLGAKFKIVTGYKEGPDIDSAMKDPALLAEAKKGNLELNPGSGQELEALAKEVVAQPRDVVERMKKLLGKQ